MSSRELQKNILTAVAYYDGMDYPLTAFEMFKYLTTLSPRLTAGSKQRFSLADVVEELDEYKMKRFIGERGGFYFLKDRKNLVEQRIERDKIAVSKLKRLRRIIRILRFAPFIRMIGVTGRLAMKNADEGSDWDVLIVLKKGKIWTGRTLVALLLQLIGKRRHGEKIKDRVCLNHFITNESLEVATRDKFALFSAHEFSFVFPLFDAGIFQKFQLRNSWIKDYKPNYSLDEIGNLKTLRESRATRLIREFGEKILNWQFLENWLRSWQRKKIMDNPKTRLPGSFIIATDQQLVFLPEPRGSELADHAGKKLEMLGGY